MDIKDATMEQLEQEVKVRKSMRYTPEDSEKYWFINEDGNVDFHIWLNDSVDKVCYKMGNVYPTRSDAQFWLNRKLVLVEMGEWALMNQGDWRPTWSGNDGPNRKYAVKYNRSNRGFLITDESVFQNATELPLFKSEELAMEFTKIFRNELLTYIFSTQKNE